MDTHLDSDLCHLAQQGMVEAYVQLRQRHHQRVQAELQKRCHGLAHADLEDLDQQVWIAVWAALPRYKGDSAFPTWLVGVTKNVLYAWLRHRHSEQKTLLGAQEMNEVESRDIKENDPLDQLTAQEAINQLPETEHKVIELRYYEQCSDQEIAARLHMPLGTVKGRLRSGLAHMRENFKSDPAKPHR